MRSVTVQSGSSATKLVYHKNKFLTPAIFELEKILHTYQQLELPSVMGVLEQE